jgi:glucose-1-phosphate adenylyltransferase
MRLKVLAFVLAGGRGTRLYPLTKERAKPAVHFGGKYRIVDFVLSNLINSGIYSVYVLVQFKSQSLLQHLSDGWQFSGILKDHFIIPVPAQMRTVGETWYRGTADAIYHNMNLIEQSRPDVVAVFGADHIYRMNVREMLEFHQRKEAEVTVAALPIEKKWASEFGVIETGPDGRILAFHEKDPDAPTIPGNPGYVYASMGNYLFSTPALLRELHDDEQDENSGHDFGKDIFPSMVRRAPMYAYDFQTNHIPGDPPELPPYWRDVGTLGAYYECAMDVRAVAPALNLYNSQWPLRTASYPDPPAKFTFDDDGRRGEAIDSIVSGGCILSGGLVRRSVLGRNVRVHAGAVIEDSIIFDNCDIGRRVKLRRVIVDKNVNIPADMVIGYDLERDRLRYHVSEEGIVVVEGRRSPVPISSLIV